MTLYLLIEKQCPFQHSSALNDPLKKESKGYVHSSTSTPFSHRQTHFLPLGKSCSKNYLHVCTYKYVLCKGKEATNRKQKQISRWISGYDLAERLERLTANAKVASSIPASSGTMESEGRQMKQCLIM